MVNMIDISEKDKIIREATGYGRIALKEDTIKKIKDGEIKKGAPLPVAEIAAINAVKQTYLLIPLCHQIPIGSVNVQFKINPENIEVIVVVKAKAKTGVEMESLIGAAIALNTIWDMVKYLEKDANGQYQHTKIEEIKVLKKVKKDG